MELRKRANTGSSEGEKMVILDSESIAEGAFILEDANGFANEVDAAANEISGLAVGFRDKNYTAFGSGHDDGSGTLVQTTTGNTYTATATNEATEKAVVSYMPSNANDVFIGELDADPGTTSGSGTPGRYLSVLVADATKIDESTASATPQQFVLVDNGEGLNSAVDTQRGGRFVLFKLVGSFVKDAS